MRIKSTVAPVTGSSPVIAAATSAKSRFITNSRRLKSLNCATAPLGAITLPLISVPGSPPLELDEEELELEDDELLDDELDELLLEEELDELSPDELELELPAATPLELLEEELTPDDELEVLDIAPLDELEEELDELLELEDELEPLPDVSRFLESELLQPNSIMLMHNATTSLLHIRSSPFSLRNTTPPAAGFAQRINVE